MGRNLYYSSVAKAAWAATCAAWHQEARLAAWLPGGDMVGVSCVDVPLAELREHEWFRRVLAVWDRWRGERFAPRWHMPHMTELPSAVLAYVTVVDVRSEPDEYVYRYWGSGHVLVKGAELTGRPVSRYGPPALREVFVEEFRRVTEGRRPLGFRHRVDIGGDDTLFQDTLRMPLSDDGETVTEVLSYADWRSRQKDWQRIFEEA